MIQSTRDELHTRQCEFDAATNHLQRCRQAVVAHERRQKELKTEKARLEQELSDVQQELSTATATESPLDDYKQQLEEHQIEEGQLKSQLEGAKRTKTEITEVNRDHKHALDAAERELEAVEDEISRAEEAQKIAQKRREKTLHTLNEAHGNLTSAQTRKTEAEAEFQQHQANARDFEEQATTIHARVPVPEGKTAEQLAAKHKSLLKQIERAEREVGGNPDQIARESTKATIAYKQAYRQLNNLEATHRSLQASVNERSLRWRRFRSEISARARIMFQYLLSERGFQGRLAFDHVNKELDLKVQPDPRFGASGSAGRQTKTLSGGEKSFSTICLLLALWDAMGSPIRCLDEFDVFMDSVNRDQSMKMMVQAARRSVGRQFILITPQGMNALARHDPDVRIHLMQEPERGQTALPFGR